MFEVTKEMVQRARSRIKRQFLTGKKQPRVRMQDSNHGIYWFKHHVCGYTFRVDSLGRAYFQK